MKIFLYKKHIFFYLIICIFIILLLLLSLKHDFSFATELSLNSILDETIQEKFVNLTKSNQKIAYLTFDDGPTLKATPKILDILKEEDVVATFFVVGKHVKENPDLVKRAYDEGHYIANHGYSHNNSKLYTDDDSFINEIKNTDIEIGKALGISNYCSHVFRFPNGYMSPNNKAKKKKVLKLLETLNYTYVDWNCLNKDSERKYSKAQLLNNLKKTAKNKGTLVVLMHDTNDVNDTTAVLKDSINYLKEQGYTFQNFYSLIR